MKVNSVVIPLKVLTLDVAQQNKLISLNHFMKLNKKCFAHAGNICDNFCQLYLNNQVH